MHWLMNFMITSNPDFSVRIMLIYEGYIFGLLVNYLARMTVIWGKNLQNIYNIDIIC